MNAIRKLRRWTALMLLGALAFMHVSLAAAACEMDRRALAQVMVAEAGQACECEADSAGAAPLSTNRCVAHCTADLQNISIGASITCAATNVNVLFLPRREAPPLNAYRDSPPPVGVPVRILLHSFLI